MMDFNVEEYASLYTGRTKILRLLFIAEQAGNAEVKHNALRVAYSEAKEGLDLTLFKKVAGAGGGDLDPGLRWVENEITYATAHMEERFRLVGSQSMDERFKIYMSTADFYASRGNHPKALEMLEMARIVCPDTDRRVVHLAESGVIDNEKFMELSDYVAPEMKELILAFHSSNFDSCWRSKLMLEMHLREHLEDFFE